ncbi:MAG: SRPBCC family protein [Armatimonadota bacterium]
MSKVESSIEINGSVDKVYNLAKRVEEFPEFMPDVKSVTILEKNEDGSRTVTEWVGIVKEFNTTIKWLEEDIWDDEAKTCTFNMIKGDYGSYSGMWKFYENDGKTIMDIEIDFEYDIPLIGALIQNLIINKMKENTDNMLSAIKARVENNGL